jgi:anaerobic ribonucleoside-triphosphate reductase
MHMTRVVGYYSRTQNWNKSKLGELKDRHQGDYGIRGAESTAAQG